MMGYKTPNIDSIAKEGALFTDWYGEHFNPHVSTGVAPKDPPSGNRKRGADGKLPPVGITVDVANATWRNTLGAPELIAVWKDPDFSPAQRACYYGRVIEIRHRVGPLTRRNAAACRCPRKCR